MGLYVSYALPILLGAIARHRGAWRKMGPFHVRSAGLPIAWCAVLWSVFVLGVCSLPPNTLAAKLLALVMLALVSLWHFFVRKRFEGPRVKLAALEGKD